mmetsp:Transcript_4853/g.8426  ORF Transcript_4853/g.8426 Transcript_4853/m.8426 type:complete len:291 (-) Transcript_4853:236-1108(-)
MISKWVDVGMNIAAHHYQSEFFDGTRPPSFGKDINGQNSELGLFRERLQPSESENEYIAVLQKQFSKPSRSFWHHKQTVVSDITPELYEDAKIIGVTFSSRKGNSSLRSKARMNGGVDVLSPLLQEAAHLLSLLSAVAMSTLRNDLEGTESPLVEYIPGKAWPDEDPISHFDEVRERFDDHSAIWEAFYHVFGISRSARHLTLFNASRPFRVIGGVSDQEIKMLQRARGAYAKTSLCFMWLQEFFTREHLNGGTGPVHAAIISRLHQFCSDGMRGLLFEFHNGIVFCGSS